MQKINVSERTKNIVMEIHSSDVINISYFTAKSIKDIFSGINLAGTSNSLVNRNIPGKKINCKNRVILLKYNFDNIGIDEVL